jgi:hypothetical protein
VRSDGVVLGAEGMEGSLLSRDGGPRLSSGPALEVTMHVLVLAVLVRAGGLDELQ